MLSNKRCYNCNQPGHVKKNCPTTNNSRKEHKPKLPPNTEVCLLWNQRSVPHCLLPDNSCKFSRQHVCLVCKKKGCKQLLHKDKQTSTESQLENKLSSKFQAQFDSLCSKLGSVIPNPTPPTSPPPPPPPPLTTSTTH